ncbi:MAG: restriction endonuclease subunit S [Candidatus Marinimicrobia bacterium]|nr:restriction endonuclease subunit S [Candidatus Neomarinimicrobiota bacterium]
MKTQISNFLKERNDRFKPAEANKLGLKRLQKIDFSGNMHFLENKETNTNMILIKSGDLVISGINVEKGAVGVYQGEEDVLATIHYSSYEFDKSKIDIDYFKWFLKSVPFKKIVQTQIKGGIKTELKPKKFLPLEIDLPDLPEQKKILQKIQSIEKEIKQLGQNISQDKILLTKLKQSILSEAVQGKLVPQNPKDEPASELFKKIRKEKERLVLEGRIKRGKELPAISEDEIPYELPKGWVWCRLGDVCEYIQRGKSPKYSEVEKYPVIAQKCIQWNGFEMFKAKFIDPETINKYEKERFVQTGDLLWNSTGLGTLGRIIVYDERFNSYDCAVADSHVTVIRPFKNFVLSKYLFFWFAGPKVQGEINNISTGSTKQTELATSTIQKYLIPLPPLSEQKRIVEKVDALMRFCDELEFRIKENKGSSENLMGAVLREVFESG